MKRLVVFAATAAAALTATAVALAATPPTLTGETLAGVSPTTSDTCSLSGGTATFTFAGTASGPYAGTFTETLTLSYGAGGFSPISGGSATFTITTADSTVTGTKTITGGSLGCIGDAFGFKFDGTYGATISASGAGYHDEGTIGGGGSSCCTIFEGFTSSLAATVPLLPTTTAQCKKGGWQAYGVFKNEGDCVSFVATRGRNAAG